MCTCLRYAYVIKIWNIKLHTCKTIAICLPHFSIATYLVKRAGIVI